MDRFDFGISPEHYFIFNKAVSTLKEMAGLNFAMTLCYHILYHADLYDDEVDEDEDGVSLILRYSNIISSDAESLLNQLIIPQSTKDLIIEFCEKINAEIHEWARYTCRNIFDQNKFSLRSFHVQFLVWHQNRKINYEKTARKMISHPGFSHVEKFKLMCEFCLEDEIQSLVPGVELHKFMKDMMGNSNAFSGHPLTYYWICKFNNELHRIHVDRDFDSLEEFMFYQEICTFSSVEYFWNFLNEREKVPVVIHLLRFNDRIKPMQKSLMSKLNEFQKHSVISQIPHQIVANFINSLDFEAARYLWIRMENSANDDLFVILLKKILKKLESKKNFSFMAQLWNTASDRHKNHFLYNRTDVVVDLFFNPESFFTTRNCSLPVLCAILSFSTPVFRRNIILEHAEVLFTNYDNCSKINKIIEFCLPNADDVVEFRNRLQESTIVRNHFSGLVWWGEFATLIKYLKTYVYLESTLKNYFRPILEQGEIEFMNKVFIFDTSTWSDINDLLKIVYGRDTLTIKNIRKKLILSFEWREEYELDEDKLSEWKDALHDLIDDVAEVVY